MKLGVVGLPNVGKSTLFNAITKAGAECANYPFCTIEPNVGMVCVPDYRLNNLAKLYNCKNGTKAINQAVKNNIEKFPKRYSWKLTEEESRFFGQKF